MVLATGDDRCSPARKGSYMTVAKVIEISSRSDVSFDDAIESGIEKASDSLNNMEAAWVQDQQVLIKDGKITGYQVSLRITFIVG